jgi:hypothetical protein
VLFKAAKDRDTWVKIKTEGKHQDTREYLLEKYNEYCKEPILELEYSKFKIYFETGLRMKYEPLYFKRRGRLNILAGLSLIFDDKKYISELEDIIWAICNEFTWALPAHIAALSFEESETFIDLFAAETGMALSEIYYLLSDRLDSYVKKRIRHEIKRRIIDSFEHGSFWWENAKTNWAGVCSGCVAATYMYMAPERFESIYPRINKIMDSFLSSFENDGACREGFAYWTYGFGYYTVYGSLLKDFTDGKIDVFKNPKIKEIAKFQERAYMQDRVIMSFADADIKNYKYQRGITSYLKSVYGDDFSIPPIESAREIIPDHCHRWAHFIRNIVWELPEKADGVKPGMVYLPDSQIYLNRKKNFAFAIKGGHNDEPHNHNDVGSFIFVYDNEQIFADFGMGEYTREYFDSQTRYSFLVNSSRGHNVPIINGQYQKDGKEYKATGIFADEDTFEADMAKAYGMDELLSLVRKCEITENHVKITDSYNFSKEPESVVERLVALSKPEISPGAVKIKNVVLKFDEKMFDCTLSEELYKDHSAKDAVAYLIDLTVKNPKAEFKCEYTISPAD